MPPQLSSSMVNVDVDAFECERAVPNPMPSPMNLPGTL